MSDQPELLTVMIPCLNEATTIGPTVEEVLGVAESLPMPVEILMIDDGSDDGTGAVMQSLVDADPRCRLISHQTRKGVGFSVIEALDQIREGSWVTGIPGDGEFRFQSILAFVEERHRYDLMLGYYGNPVIRTTDRRLASSSFNRLMQLLYGYSFRYLNGMKLYRLEVFKGIPVVSSGHAFMAELVAKAILRDPDLRVGEVPFHARGRSVGVSRAFEPKSILAAIRETHAGYRSVAQYRAKMISSGEW